MITACLVTVVVVAGTRSDGAAKPNANRIQGPPLRGATVTAPSGRTIACPLGSDPAVKITAAYFSPKLTRGTTFVPGTYRIRLTGTIANETTSAVIVNRVSPSIQDVAWQGARVTGPQRLSANSSGNLVITGRYRVRHATRAAAGARLNWLWADAALRRCGDRGLIEDS